MLLTLNNDNLFANMCFIINILVLNSLPTISVDFAVAIKNKKLTHEIEQLSLVSTATSYSGRL